MKQNTIIADRKKRVALSRKKISASHQTKHSSSSLASSVNNIQQWMNKNGTTSNDFLNPSAGHVIDRQDQAICLVYEKAIGDYNIDSEGDDAFL